MEKLAFGLEKSGVQFVWVVKEPTEVYVDGDNNTVPQGFEDRVAGKGLVIKGWAPQVAIRVGEGRKFVTNSDELSRVLVDLVSQERVECKRVAKLHGVALEAIEEGGSSVIEFDSMVSKLVALTLPVRNSTFSGGFKNFFQGVP
nr:udp-glycosyltransferase 89b1 [Quercus suber]